MQNSQSLEEEWRGTESMLLEVQCEVSTVSDDLGFHVTVHSQHRHLSGLFYCAWLASKLAWPENLWGSVKSKMRDTRPNNAEDLKAAIKATWASITPEQCHKYKLSSHTVTYTIIQSIMRSEMCSLHLTHPSAHTWSSRGLEPTTLGYLGFQVQRSIH